MAELTEIIAPKCAIKSMHYHHHHQYPLNDEAFIEEYMIADHHIS